MSGPSCLAPPLAQGAERAVLHRIDDPAINLALWQRNLPPCLTAWLATLPPGALPSGRWSLEAKDVRTTLAGILDPGGIGHSPVSLLIEDIARLAETFLGLTQSRFVDLRLEVIQNDACWKFHRDVVPLRMLTTYVGPGTEWVDPADASTALHQQKTYGGALHRLKSGDVAVFKGSKGHGDRGIVHRSPPLSQTGAWRFFACFNHPSPSSPARPCLEGGLKGRR